MNCFERKPSTIGAIFLAWAAMTAGEGAEAGIGAAPGFDFDDADGTRIVRHTDDGREKIRPAWSPDGKRLYYAAHEEGGTAIRQYAVDIGPDGRAVGAEVRLTDRKDPDYHGVPSPTGAGAVLLTTVTRSGTQGNLDVARRNAEGPATEALFDDAGRLSHQEWPAWSPDGARFAFSSTHEGNQEIYVRELEGGAALTRITRHPGIDSHPCWSSDGAFVYFATDRWGGLEIARAPREGGEAVRMTRSPGLDDYPAASPDGRWLAWTSARDGDWEIYLAPIEGDALGTPRNLSRHPEPDHSPTFTPDSKGVTFVSRREGRTEIHTIRIDESD